MGVDNPQALGIILSQANCVGFIQLFSVAYNCMTGKLVQQEVGRRVVTSMLPSDGTEDDIMFVDIAVIYCITSLSEQTFFDKLLHYTPHPNFAVANSFTQYRNYLTSSSLDDDSFMAVM